MGRPDVGRATSFGAVAQAYERYRPSYPAAAVDWLLGALPTPAPGGPAGVARHRVLDLAAGTGKLTRVLDDPAGRAARGLPALDVVAVEPLDAMRALLTDAMPGVRALPGTAEDIPLPDDHLDAVLVAQAWHWFDHDRALDEIARVLRPGGTLGLLWNADDVSVGWIRELHEMMHGTEEERDEPSLELPHRAFGGLEHATFRHGATMDADALVHLVGTHSVAAVLPGPQRRAYLDGVTEFARSHPDLAGRETFTFHYETLCWRVRRA